MISDSCLSGGAATVAANPTAFSEAENASIDNPQLSPTSQAPNRASQITPAIRTISNEARLQHLAANESYYNSIYAALPASATINASILLLAACGETENTQDGPHGVHSGVAECLIRSDAFPKLWGTPARHPDRTFTTATNSTNKARRPTRCQLPCSKTLYPLIVQRTYDDARLELYRLWAGDRGLTLISIQSGCTVGASA